VHDFGVVKNNDEYFIKTNANKLSHINLKYNKFYISDIAISITPGRTIYINVSNITTLNSNIIAGDINKEYIDLLDDSVKNNIKSFINIPQYDRF
jgi:hypothetical protein